MFLSLLTLALVCLGCVYMWSSTAVVFHLAGVQGGLARGEHTAQAWADDLSLGLDVDSEWEAMHTAAILSDRPMRTVRARRINVPRGYIASDVGTASRPAGRARGVMWGQAPRGVGYTPKVRRVGTDEVLSQLG